MQSNRRRDTRPELALRSLIHAAGFRYRVCAPPLPELRRTADLVFTSAKVAVFVDGCFWHGCPMHHTSPATNAAFWATKIAENRRRDRDTEHRLEQAGWVIVRVWEHEDVNVAADRVMDVVRSRRVTDSTATNRN